MFDSPQPRIIGLGGPRLDPVHQRPQLPEPAQPELVAGAGERRQQRIEAPARLAGSRLGVDLKAHEEMSHERARLGGRVSVRRGVGDRCVEDRFGIRESPGVGQRRAELGQQQPPGPRAGEHQRRCPLEQADRCRQVVAGQRRTSGGPEPIPGPHRQAPVSILGGGLDLEVALQCLLEVIAAELGMLGGVPLAAAIEPAGMTLVEVRAHLLGDPFVGGVTNQDVVEAVCLLAFEVRPPGVDELAPGERIEAGVEAVVLLLGHQLGQGAAVKGAPLDRRPLDHRALIRGQSVDACGEHGLDRRRNGAGAVARLGPHRHHLLEEQRVALGGLEQPLPLIRGEVGAPLDPLEQCPGFGRGEGRERDHDAALAADTGPRGALLEQLGTGEADEQQGDAGGERRDVLEQLEERRLGPVDVFHDDHEWPAPRDRFEELADRPPGLLRGDAAGCEAGSSCDLRRDELGLLVRSTAARGRGQRRLRGRSGEPPRYLCHRPVGDPLPVGKAAADGRRRHVAKIGAERPDEPGLADTRGPDDGDEPRRRGRSDLVEGLAQQSQLGLTTDERCHRAIRRLGGAGGYGHEPPRLHRRRLALEGEAVDRRQLRVRADQTRRLIADQHLAGGCGTLESLGDVDRIAERRRCSAGGLADDDLAGVDAGPHLEPLPPTPFELRVQVRERGPHLERRPRRPQRVVLVGDRDPEDGHHRVAHVLLDRAAVPGDHVMGLVEPAPDELVQRLRIEVLAELREPANVGEKDADHLAGAGARRADRGERRAAARAEARIPCNCPAARRADGHGFSLRRVTSG